MKDIADIDENLHKLLDEGNIRRGRPRLWLLGRPMTISLLTL